MLVDSVTILVKAGDGGDGSASLLRNAMTSKGGPDGGNGGNGGNVYIQGSHNITDLSEFRYKKKIIAEGGVDGRGKKLFGKNAVHVTTTVPWGTKITDLDSGAIIEIGDTTTPILIAQGGIGGLGNVAFKSAQNQTPRYAQKGGKGQERHLLLDLRFIAQVGIVGLPNAGKSSLLAVLTQATPKIGNYPFTTLEPTVGMLGTYAIADVPGIIEGASTGRGLGTTFLKHIEKTKVLVHCIDITSEDPKKAYETIRREFETYNPELLKKPEIILLTKADVVDEKGLQHQIKLFQKLGKTVYSSSIHDTKGIEALKHVLTTMLSAS
ncbi:hypothetical protein A2875_04475 [Candidatus Gottesmanbacteria bacterium RIFCSPHIGHO2_01_FULL_46_14]|uniref:GTPase Obg n=2 Tax=Candidatus Gottesmaniibacteriota TaxID=1752720 RepID=A0A1F5ZJ49_9BACT|nr:MAG: hypothetical protein A2875_04475 [Candidatus Gottesmanbacteria bacterium RIFCSPHIGHO2_01_FULL_46_14]OGG29638.1 MAG: hypothetical protein A2971_01200 [Candidatus Gottesmanbacteria bacterium RIFCSPLOWO2_01_FULL_46_21]